MQYSKILINSGTKKSSVKNLKIRSADPTRPDPPKSGKTVTRPDPTRPEPTGGSIRPVDNSDPTLPGIELTTCSVPSGSRYDYATVTEYTQNPKISNLIIEYDYTIEFK